MEDTAEWAKTATPEETKSASARLSLSSTRTPALNYEVKALHERPIQMMMKQTIYYIILTTVILALPYPLTLGPILHGVPSTTTTLN